MNSRWAYGVLNALAVLIRDGTPVSSAVRIAVIDAARRKVTALIRAEAEELAADEADRAEAAWVLRDLQTLRAWSGFPAPRPAGAVAATDVDRGPGRDLSSG